MTAFCCRLCLSALIIFIVFGAALTANSTPRVVASIPPLHGLASALMDGVATPVLLLSNRASPHDTTLMPSKARALANADIVLWIGPNLERFLSSNLESGHYSRVSIAAAKLPGIFTLPLRKRTNQTKLYSQDIKSIDPHLWLSMRNARLIARTLVDELTKIDPKNTAIYFKNLATLEQDLKELDDELRVSLKPYIDKPFVLLHDAFQYIENDYGLTPLRTVINIGASRNSAKRISLMRKLIVESGVQCIGTDPFMPAKIVRMLVGEEAISLARLDPMGNNIEKGKHHFQELIRSNIRALVTCLSF